MSGILRSRASGRRYMHISNRIILVCLLLATQALVPALLAEQQILQSVVRINAFFVDKQESKRGTGIVIEQGVITAAHIIEGCDQINIHAGDGGDTVVYDGELLFSDKVADIALIRVKNDFNAEIKLTPAVLNTNFPVQPGTEVYAIGNPLGFTRTISKGIVSASGTRRGERYLLTDALTRKGNSGGPLVNHKGEVIAMVLGGLDTAPQGQLPAKDNAPEFTYTIAAADIHEFLESKDIVQKGYLGVVGKTVRMSHGMALTDEALEVTKVVSPCGLMVGDIIVSLEDSQIATQRDLIRAVRRLSPGTKVTAFIIRNGSFMRQSVDITSR